MRHYSLILVLALLGLGGCQSFTNHMKRSLSDASDSYQRVTTGGSSQYIASQHQH